MTLLLEVNCSTLDKLMLTSISNRQVEGDRILTIVSSPSLTTTKCRSEQMCRWVSGYRENERSNIFFISKTRCVDK